MDLDPYQASLQVHTFIGASDCAYAAATYVRCEYPDGMVKVTLALAKACPAPIQKQTILKIELKVTVQGVKLSNEIAEAMSIPTYQHIFWSDSINVLYWLYLQSRQFKTDVASRAATIHMSTTSKQWQHVPGVENSADLLTQGISAADLPTQGIFAADPADAG